MNHLVKKPSRIHGTGIFTERQISDRETFYEIPLSKVFNKPLPRCARIATNLWVSDEEVLNYVNHSCNPNSELSTLIDASSTPCLFSLRPILAGEEITVDYNRTEGPDAIRIKCECQSENCRGYLLRRE